MTLESYNAKMHTFGARSGPCTSRSADFPAGSREGANSFESFVRTPNHHALKNTWKTYGSAFLGGPASNIFLNCFACSFVFSQ